jgi:VWFA-related protein
MKRLTPTPLAVLAALLAASSGPSQELEFGSSITVVSVPVFVTDSDGRSVPGLTAEDFDVRADGKSVKIVGFQELDAAGTQQEEVVRENPAARRQFLLLFDLSFTSVPGLARAREAALRFVTRKLEPADLVSVATFSAAYGVRVLMGFSTDRFQLRRAVAALGVTELDRQADPLGLVYDLTDVGGTFSDTAFEESGFSFDDRSYLVQNLYRRSEMESYKFRVNALVEGLGKLAQALDSLRGRKQVIFLSSGFDATALMGERGGRAFESSEALTRGAYWAVDSDDRHGDTLIRAELRESLRAFSTSDAVVHAIDLSGLSARGDGRFAQREPSHGSGQDSLARIADASGGRLFRNTNDVGQALDEVLELSRHYYLLAFEPHRVKGPGSFHKLKVKLKRRKGLQVSHRRGYFEQKAFAKRSPLERRFEAAELVAKGITGGDIDFRAMAVPYRSVGGRTLLPVVLEFDTASLLEDLTEDLLGLEIYGYALGEDGSVQDLIALGVRLDMGPARRSAVLPCTQCHAFFSLRPGPHELRFLVRASGSGRVGSRWLAVTVPDFAPGDVQLSPPVFVDDREGWLVVRADSRATHTELNPFDTAEDSFVPRARPTLTTGRAERFLLLAYDGGVQYDPGASLEITPQVFDSDGIQVGGGRFELDRASAESDGFRRYVVSFIPNQIPPGEYTLRVRLRDPASGRVSEAFQSVEVQDGGQGAP